MNLTKADYTCSIISELSDWELISSYSFTKNILNKTNRLFAEEHDDIAFFFFNDDKKMTVDVLNNVLKSYASEYIKRRQN